MCNKKQELKKIEFTSKYTTFTGRLYYYSLLSCNLQQCQTIYINIQITCLSKDIYYMIYILVLYIYNLLYVFIQVVLFKNIYHTMSCDIHKYLIYIFIKGVLCRVFIILYIKYIIVYIYLSYLLQEYLLYDIYCLIHKYFIVFIYTSLMHIYLLYNIHH